MNESQRETTRGTGGNVIVIDEAAHIDEDMFFDVIVPILEMKNTALLAISTPLDEFNFYSKLVELKDHEGNPFFTVVQAVRICDACKQLEYENMIKCDHVRDTAHWKSSHKHKRLKILYEGDEARGLREMAGVIASDFTPCFQKDDINALYELPRYITRNTPSRLVVAADPSGGGPSKMAIVSGFYDGAQLVITGLDAQKTRNHQEQKNFLIKHIRKLRSHHKFSTCPIDFIPENNLGLEASHLEKFVRREPNVMTFYEKDGGRAGVAKSHSNTSDYQITVEDLLIKRLVCFESGIFTVSKGETPEKMMSELRAQLERYHWEYEEPKDAFGKGRLTLTGKMGGAQDDLYIATAMVAYWGFVARQRRAGQPPMSLRRVGIRGKRPRGAEEGFERFASAQKRQRITSVQK